MRLVTLALLAAAPAAGQQMFHGNSAHTGIFAAPDLASWAGPWTAASATSPRWTAISTRYNSAGMRRIFASNSLLLPASDELVVAALALRRLRSRSSDGNELDQLEGASHVRSALDCLHRRRRYGGCRTLQGRAQGDRGLRRWSDRGFRR